MSAVLATATPDAGRRSCRLLSSPLALLFSRIFIFLPFLASSLHLFPSYGWLAFRGLIFFFFFSGLCLLSRFLDFLYFRRS